MPIYDYDGTASYQISRLYDAEEGSAVIHPISKVYDNDGTASRIIYSAEFVIYDNGNVSGTTFSPFTVPGAGTPGYATDFGSHLYFEAYYQRGGLTFNVDMTGFDTLEVTVKDFYNGGGDANQNGFSIDYFPAHSNQFRFVSTMGNGTYSMNISDLNGTHTVYLGVQDYTDGVNTHYSISKIVLK